MTELNQVTEESIFTDEFMSVDIDHVVSELAVKGYYAFPSALKNTALVDIENDATEVRLNLNRNAVAGVYAERQYFHANLLAVSKTFFDVCTSSFVLDVCKKFLGGEFRLRAQRYYETYGGHEMQWHTDNKTDRAFAHIPGIIFIFYVSDAEDGEFQYVEGSHIWSGAMERSDYSDDFIENNHGSCIRSFKMPRGSLVICNTYGVHRARPVSEKYFVRKSVLFQVDAGTERSLPVIVNTEYLTHVDRTLSMFLGFGKKAGYAFWPNTELRSLPLDGSKIAMLARWGAYRFVRRVFGLVPRSVKDLIKKILRNMKLAGLRVKSTAP